MVKKGSVKDGSAVEAETSRRATAPRRQPPCGVGTRWRQSPSVTPRRGRQSPSAIALFLSKKREYVRRDAAGLPRRRVPNATSGCNMPGSAVFTLAELRRITKDFSDDQLLGKGAFGNVYKGVLTNGDTVAVKKFASTITGFQDGQYENEIQHLMRLKHQNIVQLVGYCSETKMKLVRHNGTYVYAEETERLLCLEYMPKGSLRDHLSDETSGLEWNTRYKIIEGICHGLHYLHEEWQVTPIIHMDLKPTNILLDHTMVPKIADFGLSRLFGEEQTRTCTTSCKGTPGYMAPEYLEKGIITKKFDIFSLGVIIIEIITGLKVYPTEETETTSQQYIDTVLSNWTYRLKKTQGHISQDIDYQQINKCIQIGLLCVKFDGAKRPTINQIIKMLERSDEAYKNEREMPGEATKALTSSLRAPTMARYYDADRKKVRKRVVTCDEQKGYLFHEFQKYEREACGYLSPAFMSAFNGTSTIADALNGTPSLCRTLVDHNEPPRYKLSFVNGLDTEVFVNKVICDINGEPLTIRVLANDQDEVDAHILNAKIQVVLLHANFIRRNYGCWNREEFSNSIVRPEEFGVILTGKLQLRLTNGEANLCGATLIDSYRFARKGRFRLGMMVTDDISERVQEGITKPFVIQEARPVGRSTQSSSLSSAAMTTSGSEGDDVPPWRRSVASSSLSSSAAMTSGSDGDTESDAETHRREKQRLSNGESARRLSYRESARRRRWRAADDIAWRTADIASQCARVEQENTVLRARADDIASQCARVEQENTVLRARAVDIASQCAHVLRARPAQAQLGDRSRYIIQEQFSGVAMDTQDEMLPADDPLPPSHYPLLPDLAAAIRADDPLDQWHLITRSFDSLWRQD